MKVAIEEEIIKINKPLHQELKLEKEETKIPMKYLLEKAWEVYKKSKERKVSA